MSHDYQALTAALQLLIGDLPDADKRSLYYAAFPNSFVLLQADSHHVSDHLKSAHSIIQNAVGIADGTTPLGMLAVTNLRNELSAARHNITAVRQALGM